VLPGSHVLTTYGGGDPISYAIDAKGNVTFDASLQGILASPGPNQLTVSGVVLTINAQALNDPYLTVDYYIAESPGTFQVHVLPGSHVLTTYGGGDPVSYAIDAKGNVTFDASLQGILASPGPNQLVVNGVALNINAQALNDPYLTVDYYIAESPGTFQVHVLPGSHVLTSYGGGDPISYKVDAKGNVSYDAALEGILLGQGTSQLTVNGVALNINAQALSDPYLTVDYYIGESPGTFQVRVLPGSHVLTTYGGGDPVSYKVDAKGNVTFDASLQGVLVSPGPNQLTVNGVALTINAQALSDPYLAVDYYIGESPGTFQVHVLPGSHLLSAASGGQVAFAIDARGNVSNDPSLQGILATPGTGQLTVNGATVTFDARALADSGVIVDYYLAEATSATFQLMLLPGAHTIRSSDGSRSATFRIDASGNVDYDNAEDAILSGRGTRTLIIKALS
jgi:hypothetical protein